MKSDRIALIIGDVVHSSSYRAPSRRKIQRELEASWKRVVKELEIDEESDFGFSAGDEFEITCPTVRTALEMTFLLRLEMLILDLDPKVHFRVSIAEGMRHVQGTNPYSQDGPVFKLARLGVNELSEKWSHLTTLCTMDSRRINYFHIANSFWPAMDELYRNWTSEQAETIRLAYRGNFRGKDKPTPLFPSPVFSSRTGNELAAQLSVSQSAVSQRLERSQWKAYVLGLRGIQKLVEL